MPALAERMQNIPPSQTLDAIEKANELKRRGAKITSFSNRPATPREILEAAKKAIDEAWSAGYTDARGLSDLRQAIAVKSMRMNGLQADPDTEILVTAGAKEAIFLAMMALVNPGDEVLIPDPEWVSYVPCVELAGGRVVRFPLHEKNGFQPDMDDLERRITPKTKMIVINTPHNPTGAVFDAVALNGIAALAHKRNLVVLSDEVYEHYVYDNHKHQSIGSLPGMRERTVTISGTSKIFNMFGWRVGWAVAAPAVITGMANIHQNTVACATSFAQAGTIAALQLAEDIIGRRVRQYREARAPLIDGLNALGLPCHRPAGAYFAFPNVSKLGKSSEEVSRFLLEKGGIQSVAGSAFGPNGEGHIRLIFACTPKDVTEGVERLRLTLEQLS